jgi:hypothetical protein
VAQRFCGNSIVWNAALKPHSRQMQLPQALKREYIATTYGTSELVPFAKHT